MKNENKTLYKGIIIFISLLLLIIPAVFLDVIFIKIDNIYPQVYCLYGTSGKYESNPFFNSEIGDDMLNKIVLNDLDSVSSEKINKNYNLQTVCEAIIKNKANIKNKLSELEQLKLLENDGQDISKLKQYEEYKIYKEYKEYLITKNLDMNDFFVFVEKITNINNLYYSLGFFVGLVIFLYIMIVKLKLRKVFYWISGIAYILYAMANISENQITYLLYYLIFCHIEPILSNYIDMTKSLGGAFIYSSAAIIIFDVVFQFMENNDKKSITDFLININNMIDKLENCYFNNNAVAKEKEQIKYSIKKELATENILIRKIYCKVNRKHKRDKHLDKVLFFMNEIDNKKYELFTEIEKNIDELKDAKNDKIKDYIEDLKVIRVNINELLKIY